MWEILFTSFVTSTKQSLETRYLVVNIDYPWCNIRKFTGSQQRQNSYRVKISECYKVLTVNDPLQLHKTNKPTNVSSDEESNNLHIIHGTPALSFIPKDISTIPTPHVILLITVDKCINDDQSEPPTHNNVSSIQQQNTDLPSDENVLPLARPQRQHSVLQRYSDFVMYWQNVFFVLCWLYICSVNGAEYSPTPKGSVPSEGVFSYSSLVLHVLLNCCSKM